MARFYYLPRPYPDELIGSTLIRAARHRGQSIKRFAYQLNGTSSTTWPLFISSHLAVLADRMGLSPQELLYGQTVFPYSTARMGQSETDRLAKKVLDGSGGKTLALLVQSASVGGEELRYCQSCVYEDLLNRGESYWHRVHNLPFIRRCAVHGEQLRAQPRSGKSAGIATTRLPNECEGVIVEDVWPAPLALALLRLTANCLERRERPEVVEWRQRYRWLAELKGFPRQGTGFSAESFLTGFKQFYGEIFLRSAGLDFKVSSASAWPILLLRTGSEVATTTARHLLVQVFLENAEPPAKIVATKPGKKTRDIAVADELLVRKVRHEIARLSPGARITVTELLTRANGWGVFKHNRLLMHQTNQLILEFRQSERSERQTGRRPYWRKRLGLEK